jgi:DNA-binding NtrC family response regulator
MPEAAIKPRLFVVDDELIICSTLATILQRSGFDARAFTNPLEALKAADENPPDLLISDVMMPEMSGIDLAIQIQAAHPSCRVLLFSGQAATSSMLAEARIQGHNFELLSKPIHPTELLLKIKTVTETVVSRIS